MAVYVVGNYRKILKMLQMQLNILNLENSHVMLVYEQLNHPILWGGFFN